MVFFNDLADGLLERVELHATCLLNHFSHASLALFKCLQSFTFRHELFAATIHTMTGEVNLAHGVAAFWILLRINHTQNLQV